jgi:AcrR family transcriptional regulator
MSSRTLPKLEDLATRTLILSEAVRLFADSGYNGVSMRDLAKAVRITPAALYYHFPNKKELHDAAVLYAYRDRSRPAVDYLSISDEPAMVVLEKFIVRLCQRFYEDLDFRRLVQWTILDSATDENVREILVKVVYEVHFQSLENFLEKLSPGISPYRLAVFIFGMVMHNYNTYVVRKSHCGFDPETETPEALAGEIMSLLKHGMFKNQGS